MQIDAVYFLVVGFESIQVPLSSFVAIEVALVETTPVKQSNLQDKPMPIASMPSLYIYRHETRQPDEQFDLSNPTTP